MQRTYFEDLALAEAREADRLMLFEALRVRRVQSTPRGFFSTLFWLVGITR